MIFAPFAVVLVAWLSMAPSNTRDWQPDVVEHPFVAMDSEEAVREDPFPDTRSLWDGAR